MDNRIASDTIIEFYKDDFNFKVFAGPGAGKTYFLIKNIIETIKNSLKLKGNNNRKILCITYTNVAVDEIKRRLGDYKKYVEVSTIHSFLYEYVIKPYQAQLKAVIKQVYNCEIPREMNMYPRPEGFGLLTKLKKSEFIELLKEKYQLEIAADVTKKKLSEYVIDLKEINTYPFQALNNEPRIINSLNLSDEEALKLKTAIWKEEGVLDFDEILYFSYVLLKNFKFISYDIQYHFPYILIDEYQDTNPIQNEMIKIISSNKNVSIGVVGDVAQSIYGFQGAVYKEFKEFDTSIKHCKKFVIDGNRRSNKNIVNFLNYVRKTDDDLNEQQCITNIHNESKVKFVTTENDDIDVLSTIGEDTIVLCRRWADAFKYVSSISLIQNSCLKKIHNYYRYILDRDLIKDFENDNINWISQIRLIVKIKEAVEKGDFARIVYEASKLFKIELFDKTAKRHNTQEYRELIKFINLVISFKDDDSYYYIISKLKETLDSIELNKIVELELPKLGDENYINGFTDNLYKLELSTLKIMVNEIFTNDSKYVTIHRTKGKEYNKVFVNLEPLREESELGGIVKVLTNPKIIDDNQYLETEFTRIAYVAFSRAINDLYIHIEYIPDEIKEMIKSFDNYIKEKKIEKFYEILYIDKNGKQIKLR